MNRAARHNPFLILIALSLIVAGLSFSVRPGRGQSRVPENQSRVRPTIRITEKSPGANASAALLAAAEANDTLHYELTWTFGGKQQHGWYLYDSLIQKTLNIQDDATTPDFASAIAAWQKPKGLTPSGVLDEDSMMALVAQWQGDRLKDRTIAAPDQLITASASEFYDPERLPELRSVERNTFEAYKKMIAAAVADPTLELMHTPSGELAPQEKYFKIISAFRSREYQEELRRKSPGAGSAGLAINSPHFTGRALDLYVGGDPVDTRDANRAIQVKSPAYQWLVQNAERFGFRPYFYEPWHWEYVR